jgi:hypothetical protein
MEKAAVRPQARQSAMSVATLTSSSGISALQNGQCNGCCMGFSPLNGLSGTGFRTEGSFFRASFCFKFESFAADHSGSLSKVPAGESVSLEIR